MRPGTGEMVLNLAARAGGLEAPAACAASKGRYEVADRRRGRALDRRDHVGRLRGDRPAPARDAAPTAGPPVLPRDVAGVVGAGAPHAAGRPARNLPPHLTPPPVARDAPPLGPPAA